MGEKTFIQSHDTTYCTIAIIRKGDAISLKEMRYLSRQRVKL